MQAWFVRTGEPTPGTITDAAGNAALLVFRCFSPLTDRMCDGPAIALRGKAHACRMLANRSHFSLQLTLLRWPSGVQSPAGQSWPNVENGSGCRFVTPSALSLVVIPRLERQQGLGRMG